MEAFEGKWTFVKDSIKTFKENTMEPAQTEDTGMQYMNKLKYFEYKLTPEGISLTVDIEGYPTSTHQYPLGQSVDIKGVGGNEYNIYSVFEGDILKEIRKPKDQRPQSTAERKVEGDTMFVTRKSAGLVTTYRLRKK